MINIQNTILNIDKQYKTLELNVLKHPKNIFYQ